MCTDYGASPGTLCLQVPALDSEVLGDNPFLNVSLSQSRVMRAQGCVDCGAMLRPVGVAPRESCFQLFVELSYDFDVPLLGDGHNPPLSSKNSGSIMPIFCATSVGLSEPQKILFSELTCPSR